MKSDAEILFCLTQILKIWKFMLACKMLQWNTKKEPGTVRMASCESVSVGAGAETDEKMYWPSPVLLSVSGLWFPNGSLMRSPCPANPLAGME